MNDEKLELMNHYVLLDREGQAKYLSELIQRRDGSAEQLLEAIHEFESSKISNVIVEVKVDLDSVVTEGNSSPLSRLVARLTEDWVANAEQTLQSLDVTLAHTKAIVKATQAPSPVREDEDISSYENVYDILNPKKPSKKLMN